MEQLKDYIKLNYIEMSAFTAEMQQLRYFRVSGGVTKNRIILDIVLNMSEEEFEEFVTWFINNTEGETL